MILHGDLLTVLPTLEAESFHACVTDPPYGIGFMGREWDTFKPGAGEARIVPNRAIESENPNLKGRTRGPASSPSAVEYNRSLQGQRGFQAWTERWAREVFRVLKPGAHLVVCGAPRSHHRMMCGLEDAGFEIRDCLAWIFGQGFPKSRNLGNGWGTALKPGHEPIALARKPFKGSITANHQRLGVGGLNVNRCRVGFAGDPPKGSGQRVVSPLGYADTSTRAQLGNGGNTTHDLGRWPANVLLDDEAAVMLDDQSGELQSGFYRAGALQPMGYQGGPDGHVNARDTYGYSGGASRFFYVAKPSREERDLGCVARNIHPTVKPLDMMRWLVRLVTPTGGRVLDPFGGSGTTGMACAAEGFEFVLIEREAEYIPIIEARVRSIAPLFTESA